MKCKQIRTSLFRAVVDIAPDIKERLLLGCEQQAEVTNATSNVWKKILYEREQQAEACQNTHPPKKSTTWTNPIPGNIAQMKKIASEIKQKINRWPNPIPGIIAQMKKIVSVIKQKISGWSNPIPQMIDTVKRIAFRLEQRIGRRQITIIATVAAVAVVLAVVIPLNSANDPVNSVISIDANPCIEIRTNSSEKVLSVTPLNEDATTVLEDAKLENSSLDEVMNALIISMLEQGYISEKKNTILITVDNANPKKELSLQEHLLDKVAEILNANSLDGAVICQAMNEDESLLALASEHEISTAKAAIIKLLTEQNTRLRFAEIVKLDINEIGLLLSSWQTNLQDVLFIGNANSSAYIGENQAKSNAFVHAGVLEGAVTSVNMRMDHDNGRMIYVVEFRTANAEFGYEIDAMQGTILSGEKDSQELPDQTDIQKHAPPTHADSYISVEEAKTSALFHAELSASNVTFIRTYLNVVNGIYDVEFISGEYEFDYEIDAYSGVVLIYDHDIENYPVPSEPQNPEDGYIGREQAMIIALTNAGFSEQEVQRLRAELTKNGDYIFYEVNFRKDRRPYRYYVDATTGQILRWE